MEKANLTKGMIVALSEPTEFKDSGRTMYSTQSSITLRYQYGGSPQTFDETFYIVDSCEFDAMFRRNIPDSHLNDEKGCLPLHWGTKTEGTQPRRR
jgi:hypothetical protein